jgi:hypothetical protein
MYPQSKQQFNHIVTIRECRPLHCPVFVRGFESFGRSVHRVPCNLFCDWAVSVNCRGGLLNCGDVSGLLHGGHVICDLDIITTSQRARTQKKRVSSS